MFERGGISSRDIEAKEIDEVAISRAEALLKQSVFRAKPRRDAAELNNGLDLGIFIAQTRGDF